MQGVVGPQLQDGSPVNGGPQRGGGPSSGILRAGYILRGVADINGVAGRGFQRVQRPPQAGRMGLVGAGVRLEIGIIHQGRQPGLFQFRQSEFAALVRQHANADAAPF